TEGHEKEDWERRGAGRWLAAHGPSYARLDPVYLGDDLYSRQPICQAVRAAGGHFMFVCKPSWPCPPLSRSDLVLWPIASDSQLGPCPQLVEPDIAIRIDRKR